VTGLKRSGCAFGPSSPAVFCTACRCEKGSLETRYLKEEKPRSPALPAGNLSQDLLDEHESRLAEMFAVMFDPLNRCPPGKQQVVILYNDAFTLFEVIEGIEAYAASADVQGCAKEHFTGRIAVNTITYRIQ
jgi:hypothetical protein